LRELQLRPSTIRRAHGSGQTVFRPSRSWWACRTMNGDYFVYEIFVFYLGMEGNKCWKVIYTSKVGFERN